MTYRYRRASACAAFLCACLFGGAPLFAETQSGLAITEIMFDPPGGDSNREWVEACNRGHAGFDLAGRFFLTDGLASAKHSLSAQGPSIIPSGGCAVIVQDVPAFRADNPGYGGLIFDSSWSGLTSSAGKMLAIIDASGAVLDQITYNPALGGVNDGNSLQKGADGTWAAAAPTPGAAAASSGAGGSGGDEDGQQDDSGSSSSGGHGSTSGSPATISVTEAKKQSAYDSIRVELSIPTPGLSRLAVPVAARALGYWGELRTYGSLRYVFGDGGERTVTPLEAVEHTYMYPGSYVVSVEYRENPYTQKPSASTRATIEIAEPQIAIARVGQDGTIALANEGMAEFDLSGWSLATTATAFRIPSGTVLLAGKTLLLPANVTGLVPADHGALSLLYPSGAPWMSYAREPETAVAETQIPRTLPADAPPASVAVASGAGLAASAIGAGMEPSHTAVSSGKKRSMLPFLLALVAVVGIGAYLLRNFDFIDRPDDAHDASDTKPESAPAPEVRITEE